MKLVGMMPVRNEAWVLGLSARVALKWCDELVILDHASTDQTRDIIQDLMNENKGRIWHHRRINPLWDEMAHRQSMLECAREADATHLAIVDADEVLTANLLEKFRLSDGTVAPCVKNIIQMLPRGSMLQLPGYNLRGSNPLNYYHANGVWGRRWFSTAFVDDLRLGWSGDKFHSREPQGINFKDYKPIEQDTGGVMHLWGASERRLKAKHALYKLTERLRWPQKPVADIDRMYSWSIHGDPDTPAYGTPSTWKYAPVPSNWWYGYGDLLKYLDIDAEPWQESECVAIIKEHGPRMFDGLDLFGVV